MQKTILTILLLTACSCTSFRAEMTPQSDGSAVITAKGKGAATYTTADGASMTVDSRSSSVLTQIFGGLMTRTADAVEVPVK